MTCVKFGNNVIIYCGDGEFVKLKALSDNIRVDVKQNLSMSVYRASPQS